MSASLPPQFRPQFSGHETFPLRQLWLLKYTQLSNDLRLEGLSALPSTEKAMVRLGVGKNMVSAMRYWAEASGIVKSGSLELTELGATIFGDGTHNGLDPDSEHAATQWLVHWRLSATPEAFTTNWFLFNHVNGPTADRESILKSLKAFVASNGFKATDLTLKRSIEVCLRSYAPRMSGKGHLEDFIEPFLGDLDLIVPINRDSFEFRRSMHSSLPDGIFAFALLEYWERLTNRGATLDFNRIAYDFGSPGRVFKLDPKSIDARLSRIETLTDEALVWTEQAGLRQIVRRGDALSSPSAFKRRMIEKAYQE